MASIPRTLSRLLRRQAQTPTPTPSPLRPPISIRTAQTQATSAALNNTHPHPPPPTFQPQHHGQAQAQVQVPKSPPSANKTDPLQSHPLLQSLREDPTLRETRPHLSMPLHLQPTHLVAGTLRHKHGLTSAPYMFLSTQEEEATFPRKSTSTTLFHVGSHLCGHPGYVHGGFLSVMFDEVFAHCVSQSFKSGTGMTANLNVDFRKPALPGRVFVLQAETVKVEGRKAWVEGGLRMLPVEVEGALKEEEATLVAEARALFVEPKFAESMVPVYRN